MTVQEAINKVIKLAEAQVGYKAKANKQNKYAEALDKLGDFYNYPKEWAGGAADWCDIMIDWLFVTSFNPETGRKMLYQPKKSTGAGCGFSAGFYRENNAWSSYPQLGSQIFYGKKGNESHTGIVVAIEGSYFWTVEGNTGGGGGEVQKKRVSKSSSNIAGFGIPKWSLVATNQKFKKKWGIDVSEWQYNYNLLQAQKEGVDFVIIRGGGGDGKNGIYKDVRFEENYKKAKALGMPVGVYWFFNSFTESRAKEEAEFFFQNCLKGKQFELPIYIDVEQGVLKQSRRSLTNNVLTWLKYIRARGYWVGIYASTSTFSSNLYDNELRSYAHWIADWRKECGYSSYHGMWQFTDGEGLPKVGGQEVDQDYMYEDYEREIKEKGLNGWGEDPAPTPKPKLDEDGIFGYNSTIAAQKWRGTYEDGIVSGQMKSLNNLYPAWITIENGRGGSPLIRSIQKFLIESGYSCGSSGADGILGKDTISALQAFLVKKGFSIGSDKRGIFGPGTAKAFQKYLNKNVYA